MTRTEPLADLPPRPARLLIADAQPAMRRGLQVILGAGPEWAVAATAADGEEFERQVRACQPDVALVDLRLAGRDTTPIIASLRAAGLATRCIVFTEEAGEDDLCRSLKAGAQGYLLKHAEEPELLEAVHLVLQGRRYLTPVMAAKLADSLDTAPLSSREMEILRLLATGLPNKRIARQAAITEGTVKFHVNRILAKLACNTRTEAVAFALRRGLIRLA